MTKLAMGLILLLCACSEGATANRSAPADDTAATNVVGQAKPAGAACAFPGLDFTQLERDFPEAQKIAFAANWEKAVTRACAEKLSGERPLVDPDILGPMIVLFDAPEANIISIYDDDRTPPLTRMEGPWGSPPEAPSADDLHEAIYCAVKGATPEEEEKTGRCLPD